MSSTTASRAREGGGRQFPVGRRYVPVVDAGCGCRPRRLRLLRLPSFLKPAASGCRDLGVGDGIKTAAAAVRRSGGGASRYSSSNTSTASFSSSSGAATHSSSTGGGYSSSDYHYDYDYAAYGGEPAGAVTKQQQQKAGASPARRAPAAAGKEDKNKATKKKRHQQDHHHDKMATADEEDGHVGVAVEKDSSDPRADFRESMVQMVVEMGLCDWDGLRCMLRRLLALNAPRHHAAILTAFAEVCAQIIAPPAASSPQPSPTPAYQYHHRR